MEMTNSLSQLSYVKFVMPTDIFAKTEVTNTDSISNNLNDIRGKVIAVHSAFDI